MRSVAIVSVAGAPGVSTLIAAIAASAGQPLLAVEAAPAGGVVAARWGWPRDGSIAELALEADTVDLWQAARRWIDQSRVLPADPSPTVMRQAQPGRWLATQLGGLSVPVVIDAGRVDGSPDQLELLTAVDRRWLLVETTVSQVVIARATAAWLQRAGPVGLLAREPSGRGHHRPGEVAGTLGWPLIATVPADSTSAETLAGVVPARRGLRQAPLLRTGHLLAGHLTGQRDEGVVSA